MEKISAGIDLGTTNSCLAVLQGNRPVVIANDLDEPITPSLVSIQPDGIVVGKKARSFLLTHPTSTFASIKSKMGKRYSRTVLGKEYTPESISALILAHLKKCAEDRLDGPIGEAVITVPANFNSVQRQATKDAGEIAGFKVLRVINEPTAAALAYGHEHKLSAILLVFDLGGGTFDISVVEAGDGVYEVIYSLGDNALGGDDFNLRIVNWIVQEFQKQTGLDLRRDVPAVQLVHEWAVAAKHGLTKAGEVRVKIDNLFQGKSFDAVLKRPHFEEMCRDLFDRLRSVARKMTEVLNAPKYRDAYPGAFENQMAGCDILLVGGETRVPAVRQLVNEIFRGTVHGDVNPDEVVAMGAALEAGIIHQKGGVKDIILVDTTALSLGIELFDGRFSRLIETNTKIPCTHTKEYRPYEDHQSAVSFPVYQGEHEIAAKNVKLGEFELTIEPPRKKTDVPIDVTFHLDADDILHVSAVDRKTGIKQSAVIRDTQNLDRATVEKLKQEANASREEEQAIVKELQGRQRQRDFMEEVEERLTTYAARDPQNKFVRKVQDYLQRLQQALAVGDEAGSKQAAGDLHAAWQKLQTALPRSTPDPVLQETAVPRPTQQTTGGDKVNCANCGARLPPGFAFCGRCGLPLKKEACDKCGAALVEGFEFCGKCGAKA